MVRRFQFRLKSLMAAVAVICLGLGGWHLLFKYGQYIEAEPAVVGEPIKIRGRFFRLFGADERRYRIDSVGPEVQLEGPEIHMVKHCDADNSWWWFAIEEELYQMNEPGEYTLTLTPEGGSTIRGANFFVRHAD